MIFERVARKKRKTLSRTVREALHAMDDGCDLCGAQAGEECTPNCEDRR